MVEGLKKIINPWISKGETGYNCFCCAPHNPAGMKMEFFEDGDEVISTLEPGKNYESWMGVIHGGIQCTAMDEIGMWCVNLKMQTAGVTRNLNAKYIKSVSSLKPFVVHAKIREVNRMFVFVDAWITQDGQKCTEADIKYYVVSKDIAARDFYFTGLETE